MAETGINWADSWSFAQMEAGDWDNDDSSDDEIQTTSTAIYLDGSIACLVGVHIDEPDDDAVVANSVTISVLGDTGDAYENALSTSADVGNAMKFKVTPVQDSDVYILFSVSALDYDDFNICIMNESGANLNITVQYKLGTVPAAS